MGPNDSMEGPSELVFFVNGRKIVERDVDPEITLVWYLRNKLRLVGTKIGCGQGACGSCTIMISEKDRQSKAVRHSAVVACLVPLCTLHGKAVTTVEGIGSTRTKLHPVQERLAKSHGVQCGFCSPGMIMSMYTLLRNNPQPSIEEIQTALQGNLCRCTGYRAILAAHSSFAEGCCSKGADCCMNKPQAETAGDLVFSPTFDPSSFSEYDPTQDLIFPSELELTDFRGQSLVFRGPNITFYQPGRLEEVFDILEQHPKATVSGGCVTIAPQLQNGTSAVTVNVSNVVELKRVTPPEAVLKEGKVTVGAALTINELQATLKHLAKSLDASKARTIDRIAEILGRIGSVQVRNLGTIGGNIGSGRAAHDLATWLAAAGCQIKIFSKGSSRIVPLDMGFYINGSSALKPGEVIGEVHIPLPAPDEYYRAYKHSKRPEFDWSVVSAGMDVQFEAGTTKVKQLTSAFSNLGPTVLVAKKTGERAVGRDWDDSLLADLQSTLLSEIDEVSALAAGEKPSPFRRTLAVSFLQKFYYHVRGQIHPSEDDESLDRSQVNGPIKATQLFEEVPEGQTVADAVGRPVVHQSAFECAAGQARYFDDIPKYENEVHVALVLSTKAHAKILGVDPSAALDLPGVVCYLDHRDVPGENSYAAIIKEDEELFATEKVVCEGTNIGAIVAEDYLTARKAARLVKVTYEELKPIITIEDAMAANPDKKPLLKLRSGDVDDGFKAADHVLEGEVRTGAQEHFYMEPHAGIAVPIGEHQEIELIGTTQCPVDLHRLFSRILGVDRNRIGIKVKRLGGAFGGKEIRVINIWGPAAIAAMKLQRPARCVVTREEDMLNTGKRHPALFKYKVGFSKEGKLIALDVALHLDCGYCNDVSEIVLNVALLNIEGSYKIPHLKADGYVWYTNTQCNTAFRGFGGPQANFCMENIIHDVAQYLGITQEKVRELNMLKQGDAIASGQVLENCTLAQTWPTCLQQSDIHKTRQLVEEFNRKHEWVKRGVAVTNVRFHVVFCRPAFINQAGALVNVFLDGTVLIHHGGIEMGQGLHTKIIQIASRVLNLPTTSIHIKETITDVVPNSSLTAGSHSVDFWGGAVKNACEKLITKLQPYKEKKPEGSWNDWVMAAYLDQVNLSTTGFWKNSALDFDWETGRGRIADYFTYGTSCSLVEVDCLTGDHKLLKTDLVMDVGRSVNPAIDVGQIEGGFMQGYGLYVLEENIHTPEGNLVTKNPHTYKIPTINTIPKEFNVTILKGTTNETPTSVYSSKGVGEPPLLMGASVFMAIKEAILARRRDNGLTGIFRMDAPATSERIRMACGDKLISK